MAEKKPGFFRRNGGRILGLMFPSFWISKWADRKKDEVSSPAAKRVLEALTYRKAYGLDEMGASLRDLGKHGEKRGAERERHGGQEDLSAEERYARMLVRNGFTERDRQRGIKRLRTEVMIAKLLVCASLGLIIASAIWWGWNAMAMSLLSFVFAYVKGTVACFYLWQSELRACHPFSKFLREGGAFQVFEWGRGK